MFLKQKSEKKSDNEVATKSKAIVSLQSSFLWISNDETKRYIFFFTWYQVEKHMKYFSLAKFLFLLALLSRFFRWPGADWGTSEQQVCLHFALRFALLQCNISFVHVIDALFADNVA